MESKYLYCTVQVLVKIIFTPPRKRRKFSKKLVILEIYNDAFQSMVINEDEE